LNPAAIFKERFTNINTAKAQIEKQREREQMNDRLTREFAEIDINGDGKVSIEELHTFL
jgi:Ca2+-binding EF-hand superfamily protein